MLTHHTIKILQSLDKKKFRQKYNLFLVEGDKIISELENSDFDVKEIFSISPETLNFRNKNATKITEKELKKISFLQHPKNSVAVVEQKLTRFLEKIPIQLVLDGIQDPGNLGTIIRLADWFGIQQIICSEDTVDFYNPKVIQSSMGSYARVNIVYLEIKQFLTNSFNLNIGTDMLGQDLYEFQFPEHLNLILGNEGNGIRESTELLLHHNIAIPRFGSNQTTESLNVSMAAGIILGQIFGKKINQKK